MSEKNKLLYEELSGLDRDHLIDRIKKSLDGDLTRGIYDTSDGKTIFWNIELKTYDSTFLEDILNNVFDGDIDEIPHIKPMLNMSADLTEEDLLRMNVPNTVALSYLESRKNLKEEYHE